MLAAKNKYNTNILEKQACLEIPKRRKNNICVERMIEKIITNLIWFFASCY